jgi:hypothetical protein
VIVEVFLQLYIKIVKNIEKKKKLIHIFHRKIKAEKTIVMV